MEEQVQRTGGIERGGGVISDFGLARLRLTPGISIHTTQVIGTPHYMSPEQCLGKSLDERSDIYSLGVMLYEMLAGVVPFDAESSFGILMKHLNDPPPPIFGISPDLQLIIDRALAKDPKMRYATATELADEFTAVFNGHTVSDDTIRLLNIAKKSVEKPKQASSFSWMWAVVGVLLIIGLAFGAFRFPRPW